MLVCFLFDIHSIQIQRKYNIKLKNTQIEETEITSKAMMYVRIAHKSLATYTGLFPMGSRNKNKMVEDIERGQKR